MDKLTSSQQANPLQYWHPDKPGLFSRSNWPCVSRLKGNNTGLIFYDIMLIECGLFFQISRAFLSKPIWPRVIRLKEYNKGYVLNNEIMPIL